MTKWDTQLKYVQQKFQHLKSAKMYLDKVSIALHRLKLHFGALMTHIHLIATWTPATTYF